MTVPSVPTYPSPTTTALNGSGYVSNILGRVNVGTPAFCGGLGDNSSTTHHSVFGLYGGRPYARGAHVRKSAGSISPQTLGEYLIDYFDTTANTLELAVQSFLPPGGVRCTVTVAGLGTGSAVCSTLGWSIPIPGIGTFLRARLGATIRLTIVLE